MASTRFHDDAIRQKKQLQEMTDQGRWMLNVPGNGVNVPFMNDPHCRLQHWGANLRTNSVDIQSDLLGLTKHLSRDKMSQEYKKNAPITFRKSYGTSNNINTDQSRSTHPVWQYRDLEQNNFDYVHFDPQENTCLTFQNNLNTRMLEKDNHKTVIPKYFNK